MSGPSPELLAAMAKSAPKTAAPTVTLDQLRATVARARELEHKKEKLSEELSETSKELNTLYSRTLVDLLDEAGVPSITLEAQGDLPKIVVDVKPFYSANIAASWEAGRKENAFEYLIEIGHGGLIKSTLTIAMPREKFEEAEALADELRRRGIVVDLASAVNSRTLTAWLKEQVEKYQNTPDLEVIGGTVGRIAKLTTKEK